MSSEDSNDVGSGRGSDQGESDERHSDEFREEQSEKASSQPRDPETGQFLPTDGDEDGAESTDERAQRSETDESPGGEGEEPPERSEEGSVIGESGEGEGEPETETADGEARAWG